MAERAKPMSEWPPREPAKLRLHYVVTPHGALRRMEGRHGYRWYLEVPGCPNGEFELLDARQLRGEVSVNHAAVCDCGYHETHNFAEHIPEGWPDA